MKDMNDMMNTAEFELHFRLPGEAGFKRVPMVVDAVALECVRPLPRDREVPFMPRAAELATQMARDREKLANDLARIFAKQIVKAMQTNDPVNGYSPVELALMNRTPEGESMRTLRERQLMKQ